jgi:2-hydroxy-3-oxopropionate reductase
MSNQSIGFIGLGIMGRPMAKNLINAGYELVVYDLNQDAVDELVDFGAAAADSPREVAQQTDVIITMVPNGPNVIDAVLEGPDSVIRGLQSGQVVIDMSSIAPTVSQQVGDALSEIGAIFFDAPVSGGEPKAIDGSLSIMVGGPDREFEEIKPILSVMGGSVVLVGDVGSGNTTKLANQIIVAANIAALAEALTLATKAGVDPEKVFQAIRGGLAGSTVMEAKAPMMLDGNYEPGFRIDLHVKDLNNVLETAQAIDTKVTLTEDVISMFRDLQGQDKGTLDHSALVQIYEQAAGVKVRK